MKIANVVTDSNLNLSEYFNVVKNFDEIDENLPTLIVGYEYAKELFPSFNVSKVHIQDNIYWTVKKFYDRDKFQEDLTYFLNQVYLELIKDVKYVFIDLVLYSPRKVIKIIKKIYSLKGMVAYRNDNMIYIYGENLIFGLDLNLVRYIGISEEKVIGKIKSMSVSYIDFKTASNAFKEIFDIIDNKIRYAPYLHTVLN